MAILELLAVGAGTQAVGSSFASKILLSISTDTRELLIVDSVATDLAIGEFGGHCDRYSCSCRQERRTQNVDGDERLCS